MPLLKEEPAVAFDLTKISRGCLLWGMHFTWDEGRAGFVTSATKEQLIVQYHPGIGNVTNHFIVPVSEVADGQWKIRWSEDLSEVHAYGIKENSESSGTGEDGKTEEGTEAEGKDGSGGAGESEGGMESDETGRVNP